MDDVDKKEIAKEQSVEKGINVQNQSVSRKKSPHWLKDLGPGVMGLAGIIWPGQKFVYDFVAQPYGVYPYHCLMAPVEEHINRGLYGMMIIDQPYAEKGPHATEMVVLINGYSFTKANQTNPTEEGPPTPAS